MIGKPLIIGAGDVECSLCKPGSDPKDGLALEVDGAEQQFCWSHLKAMTRMWRNAWMQQPKDDANRPPLERIMNGN